MPGPLAAKIRAKYPGAYDDMDDAALEAAVLAKYPEYRDLAEESPTDGRNTFDEAVGSAASKAERIGPGVSQTRERIAGALPTAAALAASLATGGLGIPAAMAATGAAGGAGSILGSLLGGRKVDTAEAGLHAALQGGVEGVTRGAGKFFPRVAERLYGSLLKPTDALANRYGGEQAIVRAALKERLPISTGGVEKAGVKLTGAVGERDALAQAADAAGAPDVNPVAVARHGLGKTRADRLGNSILPSRDRAIIDRVEADFLKDNAPQTWSNVDAVGKIRALTDEGMAAQRAARMGERSSDLESVAWKDMADTARGMHRKNVPGMEQAQSRVQGLSAAKRGIKHAVKRDRNRNALFNMNTALAGGAGAGLAGMTGSPELGAAGSILGKVLTMPSAGSRAALALDAIGPYMKDVSTMGRLAIIAGLMDEEE